MSAFEINTIHIVYSMPRREKKLIWYKQLTNLFQTHKYSVLEDYSWPDPIPAPLSISFNLIKSLSNLGKLKFYNITDTTDLKLKERDIFIGHPWPDMKTRSLTRNEWEHFDPLQITNKMILKYPMDKRVFAISPFNFDEGQMAWAFPLIDKVHTYIGICGDVWADNFEAYPGKKHFNNFFHVNMAIARKDYPCIKKTFSPPGKRRFLYIGRASDEKGLQQMIDLKKNCFKFHGASIGCKIEGWECLTEWTSLNKEFMIEVANSYDVIISFSTMDAQATTILEAMSWGFMVACTEETGYKHPSVFSLRLNDMNHNIKLIESIQQLDLHSLMDLQQQNFQLLDNKYCWQIFADKISKLIKHAN